MSYSVIVPIYNAENTLRRCLDSIVTATKNSCQTVEIILVNDGSVDNSETVCKEYIESNEFDRICVCYHSQQNEGPGSARNKGLSLATGDYILFVDSDDYVTVDYFTYLETLPDADLVEFDYVKNKKDNPIELIPVSVKNFISNRSGAVAFKRFKLSIIRDHKISFPLDIYIGEDVVFGLKYSVHSKTILKTNAQLYYYDQSESGSLTRHYKSDACEQVMRIYRYEFDIIKNSSLSEKDKQDIFRSLDYNYCRTMFVDVEELFRKTPKFSVKEFIHQEAHVLNEFRKNKEKWYKSLNLVHFMMQICVTYRLGLIVYLVSKSHYCLSTLGNRKKVYDKST